MKKLKGSRNAPTPFFLISVAALSLCALLPLRVYHVSCLIQSSTGFFVRNSWTIWTFYLLCAAVMIYLMTASYQSSKVNRVRNCMVRNRTLAVVSVLTGVAVLYDAVSEINGFIELSDAFSLASGTTKLSYLTKNGGTALLFGSVFAALSAVFFLVYAFSCFNKKISMSSFRILSVAPVAWSICRMIHRFVTKISFVNVSDLLLELFMLVFLISFTLAFAQVVTGVMPEICAWRLVGCGLPAALLAFLTSMPRLIMLVLARKSYIVVGHGFAPCDLMLAVFIPLFLYYSSTVVKKRKLKMLFRKQKAQASNESAGIEESADKE